jgi:hypothetical protein
VFYPVTGICAAHKPEGGNTQMPILKWLRRFWFKLKIEFTAGFNDKPK